MTRQENLKNVPANKLQEVVQSFRDNGATQVDTKDNGDGRTFDVTATFPIANQGRQETLENVPADKLQEVIQSFRDDGATQVDTKDNGDGTLDVTATFP